MTEARDTLLATAVIPGLPQSVNRIWRNGGNGRTYKTKAAKEWQEIAAWHLREGRKVDSVYNKSVKVDITLYTDKNTRWDIDNRCKQILDSLATAGIILDDVQVRELHVKRVAGVRDETEISIFAI